MSTLAVSTVSVGRLSVGCARGQSTFLSRISTMNHARCIYVGTLVETIGGGKIVERKKRKEIQPPTKK